jgi:hypothetical protein
MKTRRRNTPQLKRRAKAPPARRQRSPAADLQKQLDGRTRELAEAQKHLAEALEQQTATSEVLKIISRSAFDLQSVLDSLVENAVRLCSADKGLISRRDGQLYHFAASYGHSPEFVDFKKRNPIRKDRTTATGRWSAVSCTFTIFSRTVNTTGLKIIPDRRRCIGQLWRFRCTGRAPSSA